MTVWKDDDFMSRRAQARQRLDRFSGGAGGDWADRRRWFWHVYQSAGDDPAPVPLADLEPQQALVEWLHDLPPERRTGRAIDVACGLGDNAEVLASAGFDVTAFDLSADAIAWAKRRFPQTQVDYRTADLFDYPESWEQAFDFVHETYTIQALHGELRRHAIERIARLIARGGCLLVICRGRDEGQEFDGPPWPLSKNELAAFREYGLAEAVFDDFIEERDRSVRHFRVEYRRP